MTYDPVLAAASVRELAAFTDQELAQDARDGIAAVVAAWALWRADPAYPRRDHVHAAANRDRDQLVAQVGTALDALPAAADLPAVVAVATRLLGEWWGVAYPAEVAVSDAVDRLHCSAIHRPGLAHQARAIARSAAASITPARTGQTPDPHHPQSP